MGFGIGILVTLVPLYQSEVSPAESRGLMVGLHGVLIGFSYSLTGFVTYGCYFASYGQFQVRRAVPRLPAVANHNSVALSAERSANSMHHPVRRQLLPA